MSCDWSTGLEPRLAPYNHLKFFSNHTSAKLEFLHMLQPKLDVATLKGGVDLRTELSSTETGIEDTCTGGAYRRAR